MLLFRGGASGLPSPLAPARHSFRAIGGRTIPHAPRHLSRSISCSSSPTRSLAHTGVAYSTPRRRVLGVFWRRLPSAMPPAPSARPPPLAIASGPPLPHATCWRCCLCTTPPVAVLRSLTILVPCFRARAASVARGPFAPCQRGLRAAWLLGRVAGSGPLLAKNATARVRTAVCAPRPLGHRYHNVIPIVFHVKLKSSPLEPIQEGRHQEGQPITSVFVIPWHPDVLDDFIL